jgi:hypothetical protein
MQKKSNALNDNPPNETKNGGPKEANFVKKQVSQLNFQRTETLITIIPPKPILPICHVRWVREADDTDHKEGAPVDWVPEGHVVDKRGEDDFCNARASVAEGIGHHHGKDGHPPRLTA